MNSPRLHLIPPIILAVWVILTLVNYYYVIFIILPFMYLGMIIGLLIVAILQLAKLKRKEFKSNLWRIISIAICVLLFIFTFNINTTNRFIEKIDWKLLKSRRVQIVENVKNDILVPNVSYNNVICELPFEFPVVSNGGNDIWINKNQTTHSTRVIFWVFRNFFESPQTCFVFTDDPETIENIDKHIKEDPDNNWKIEEHWYRTYGEWMY
jgi:energy-coupling factor transporter transmembrane protein EcfT